MQNQPLVVLLMICGGSYVAKLWLDDYRAQKAGKPASSPLPGATPAPTRAALIAAIGAIILLAAETWGEHLLGITSEQSTITTLFAFYTLVAAIVEEIIFRGYIVLQRRGATTLRVSIIVASVLFALCHQFLWDWQGGWPWADGKIIWKFSTKAWFSTAVVFAGSLWFYFVRFAAFNAQRSLIPCFAAHMAKNLGVILVKASTGFFSGLF